MANFCENTIKIANPNPKTNSKLFKQLLTKINTTFNKELNPFLIALTKTELDELYKTDKNNSKINKKLGTKWITIHDVIPGAEDYIELYTDSAWAPPLGWAKIISKKYKCIVQIKYDEPGCCFMGLYLVQNGIVKQNHCHEYTL